MTFAILEKQKGLKYLELNFCMRMAEDIQLQLDDNSWSFLLESLFLATARPCQILGLCEFLIRQRNIKSFFLCLEYSIDRDLMKAICLMPRLKLLAISLDVMLGVESTFDGIENTRVDDLYVHCFFQFSGKALKVFRNLRKVEIVLKPDQHRIRLSDIPCNMLKLRLLIRIQGSDSPTLFQKFQRTSQLSRRSLPPFFKDSKCKYSRSYLAAMLGWTIKPSSCRTISVNSALIFPILKIWSFSVSKMQKQWGCCSRRTSKLRYWRNSSWSEFYYTQSRAYSYLCRLVKS